MSLIDAIQHTHVKDLTIVSNNCGIGSKGDQPAWGLGVLLENQQVKRMVSSYVGENDEFARQYFSGELEVVLTPQGTLAEKLRAGGAGIAGFFVRTGTGSWVSDGGLPIKYDPADNTQVQIESEPKEVRVFNDKNYVFEEAIQGDVSIVKAWKGDRYGNLVFRGTARNFNPECAKAGKFTIAEVEHIVEIGEIAPNDVDLPGVYVDAIVEDRDFEKKIEFVTVTQPEEKSAGKPLNERALLRERIVRRAAAEIQHGMSCNLGIGMPTLAANYVPEGVQVMYQSENGLLGMGPFPAPDAVDADWINAGKQTVTHVPGASLFSSGESFEMIRSGNIDVTILGAMEVARDGSIANWIIPGKMVKGMGGAMDLVNSGSKVIVTMEHCDKYGNSKVVEECNLPLTGEKVVNLIITDKAVFEVCPEHGLVLKEIGQGETLESVKEATDAHFMVPDEDLPFF